MLHLLITHLNYSNGHHHIINNLKENGIYILFTIIIVGLLIVITNKTVNWTKQKLHKRFSHERPKSLNLIKQVLNILWTVLGIISVSFLFINESEYGSAAKGFDKIIYLGLVALLALTTGSTVNLWFKTKINERIANEEDPTNFKFLRYIVVAFIYFTGVLLGLMAFPSLKGFAQTALGGAGIIALVAGIASQEAFANVISGIFIISFKPFKVGDTIRLSDGTQGNVIETNLRHTIIKDYDNKMFVIPNAVINKDKLLNFDLLDKKCCERIQIGISYDSDIDLAKQIMQEESEKHPLTIDVRTQNDIDQQKPKVKTAVIDLGESSVIIRAWVWANDYSDAFQLKCDLIETIKKRFDKEGIEIPFPYTTVVFKDKPIKPTQH